MRRIQQARIRHISLVKKGANRFPVIYKSADQTVTLSPVCKWEPEEGLLIACVYAPEHRDAHGDIASAEVIKEMCYEFAKSGEGISIQHNGKTLPKDQVYVAEHFIIQKGDPRYANFQDTDGNPVDPTGGWGVIIKIESDEVKALYRSGDWHGVSMEGPAKLIDEKPPIAIKFLEQTYKQVPEMTAEEMAAILAKSNELLSKTLLDGLTKVLKPEEPPKKEEPKKDDSKPAFEGDPSNQEDILKHFKKVTLSEALKKVDFSDPASVKAYTDLLQKFNTSDEEDTHGRPPSRVKKAMSLKGEETVIEKWDDIPLNGKAASRNELKSIAKLLAGNRS